MNNYFTYGNKKITSGTRIIFTDDFCSKNKYALKNKNSSVFRGVTNCNDGKSVWHFDNRCFQDFIPERDVKSIEMSINNRQRQSKSLSVNETLDIIFPKLMTYIMFIAFFSITNYRMPMWILSTFIFICSINKKIYF